jgi:hypothetical protein
LLKKWSFWLKNGQFKVLIAQQGRLSAVAIFHLIVKLHFQEKISSGTTAHLMLEPFFLKNGCFSSKNGLFGLKMVNLRFL